MEARREGYRSHKQNVTLKDNETCQLDIPALAAVTSSLKVDYQPVDAEVWVDGNLLGTSPDIFRGLSVGRHEVELRKEGYRTKKETVTVSEGQTAQLTGQLEKTVADVAASGTSTQVASNTSGTAVETITVNGVSFRMVRVEGGTFQMGSKDKEADSDEKRVHQVTLSSYSIGETEVMQELWQAVMGSNPSEFKGAKNPVERVRWKSCHMFVRKLNSLTGRRFRLPTEAEWEFAARGGLKSRGYKYAGGNDIDIVAWYGGNSGNTTHDVGTKQPNELGLYDMTGNVWEWCQDWYGDYSSSAQTNPTGPSSGLYRVCRGGSWISGVRYCCCSFRGFQIQSNSLNGRGLRLAL